MSPRFVICGTDTGVGKTVFAAALADALDARYWKPVQSGLDDETDSEVVTRLGSVPAERILSEAYRLATPASPHLAASLDGVEIDPFRLSPPEVPGALIIEGAGGLLVPLTEKMVFADVFGWWNIPVILCARTSLGTINHTLLSIEALRRRNIPLCGVAFIGTENPDTQATIAAIGQVTILGRLPFLASLTHENLRRAFSEAFDIGSLTEVRA